MLLVSCRVCGEEGGAGELCGLLASSSRPLLLGMVKESFEEVENEGDPVLEWAMAVVVAVVAMARPEDEGDDVAEASDGWREVNT